MQSVCATDVPERSTAHRALYGDVWMSGWAPIRQKLEAGAVQTAEAASGRGHGSSDVSIDFGATWQPTKLSAPKNPYDWQRWIATVKLPSEGYYEIWARATDSRGIMQPHIAGNWNPQGYAGNAMHRVAIRIA